MNFIYLANKYKEMYMRMALVVAQESKAERRKVGCVIVSEEGEVFHGMNGMPSGSTTEVCEDSLGLTKPQVLHAEQAALRIPSGSVSNSTVFITYEPCYECAKKLIDEDVGYVYYNEPYKGDKPSGIRLLLEHGIRSELLTLPEQNKGVQHAIH